MGSYLSAAEMKRIAPAETASFRGPMPTQIVSNGEFVPVPQTREQQRVEARVKELAATLAPRHGMSRRRFLASSAGMAAAMLAMNEVFGPTFDVSPAEAQVPGVADARAKELAGQFIFDCQTHFVRDDYDVAPLTQFAQWAKLNGNPDLQGQFGLTRFKFENYVKEVFVDSDTKIALLSGTPSDIPEFEALGNDQILAARDAINAIAGSRRMLGHAIVKPGQKDWMARVEAAIAAPNRAESWKGYTIGDPFLAAPASCWRLDDEKLMYPFYQRIRRAGMTTVCVHKGILSADYARAGSQWVDIWDYATVWDVARAARDWPDINFVIYHSAARPVTEKPDASILEFAETGRLRWASDLADIPQQHPVKNVYAEIGTAFATFAVAAPRLAASLLGILIKGMGADHVLWGTDSVWYGSPQWQIEAMRRLEIPVELQKKYGFAPLGPADGPVKRAILGENAARLYKLPVNAALGAISKDTIAAMKAEYVKRGGLRSNARYGYVDPGTA